MNEKLIREINQKRKELENNQTQKLKLEGRMEELHSQLNKKHSCSSVIEAKEKIDAISKKIEKLEDSMGSKVEEWKNKYDR